MTDTGFIDIEDDGSCMFYYPECFVAYLDILGFSSVMHKIKTFNELGNYIKKWHSITDPIQLSIKVADEWEEHSHRGQISSTIKYSDTNIQIFSDCMIIWTNNAKRETLKKLVDLTLVLFKKSLFNCFFLRGGISKGWLTGQCENSRNDTNIFINRFYGNALTKAHDIERKQEWSGVVIDHNEVDIEDIKQLITEEYVIEYSIPCKNQNDKYKYALNWPKYFVLTSKNYTISEQFEKMFTIYCGIENIDDRINQKINNTTDFYMHCRKDENNATIK